MSSLTNKKSIEEEEKLLYIQRSQELNDIKTVLSTISGRRFLWKIMSKARTFASVFSENSNVMSYRSGKQDLGRFVMAEITEADENLLLKMMKENMKEGNENEAPKSKRRTRK